MEVNHLYGVDFDTLTPTQQVNATIAQNNSWSAAQAQKQMDFQREMSNTAHQREVADLKAAGLNPVLSAKLGGASTPSGSMGTTDTSGSQALIDLLGLSMQAANSAASAASGTAAALESGQGKIMGLDPLNYKYKNPRNPAQMAWNACMDLASSALGDKNWTLTEIIDFGKAMITGDDNSAKSTGSSGAQTITIPGTSIQITVPKGTDRSGGYIVPDIKAFGSR